MGAKARRRDFVVEAVESANAALAPEDRRAKYRAMAESPYVFFRGTNHLFWEDFAADPRLDPEAGHGSPATRTWLAGDAHAANLGVFGDARGRVVYGLNDFDEAIIHDFRYDLWRLAVSAVLIARQNKGFGRTDRRRLAEAVAAGYLAALARPAPEAALTASTARGRLGSFLADSEQRRSDADVKRWTRRAGGGRRFDIRQRRLEAAGDGVRARLEGELAEYASRAMYGRRDCEPGDFTLEDVAIRTGAGVGSLGRARYYLLVGDRREGRPDHRILEVKQQVPPAGYAILTDDGRAAYDGLVADEGRRHAVAFHAMTPDPDPFLGWIRLGARHFSVRERSPFRRSFDTEQLTKLGRFRKVAEQWGAVLAGQHVLGDRNIAARLEDHLEVRLTPAERKLIALDHHLAPTVLDLVAGREDEFLSVTADVATGYAGQVKADWKAFCEQLG